MVYSKQTSELISNWDLILFKHCLQDEHQQLHEDNFPLVDEELSSVFVKAPRNLSVEVVSGTQAVFSWDPPEDGEYDKFEVQLSQLPNSYNYDEQREISPQQQTLEQQQPKTFSVEDRSVSLSSFLEPGNSYHVKVYSVLRGELSPPTSANFTTSTDIKFTTK